MRGVERGGIRRLLRVPLSTKLLLANAFIVTAAVSVTAAVAWYLPDSGRWSVFVSVAGLVLAVTVPFHAVVVHLALSPLDSLARTTERIREGDLTARVGPSPLADERIRGTMVLFNRMMDDLESARARHRELARGILEGEEGDRRRIAEALYGGPAQTLAGLLVRLRLAERMHPSPMGPNAELTHEIRAEVTRALEEVRSLARRLSPPELKELGVQAALEAHARTLTEGRATRVVFENRLGRVDTTCGASTLFFRIVQEAITEAVLVERAPSVRVRLEMEGGRLKATIRTEVGASPTVRQPTLERGGGGRFDVTHLAERASYAGGRVSERFGDGIRELRVDLPCAGAGGVDGGGAPRRASNRRLGPSTRPGAPTSVLSSRPPSPPTSPTASPTASPATSPATPATGKERRMTTP